MPCTARVRTIPLLEQPALQALAAQALPQALEPATRAWKLAMQALVAH